LTVVTICEFGTNAENSYYIECLFTSKPLSVTNCMEQNLS